MTLPLAALALASAIGLRAADCVSIICPDDIITGCQTKNGATVEFKPDAKTDCTTTIEVACQPPSGTLFPIGTNLVSCAVSDPRGNMARCDFKVIVTNAAPEIQCPSDILAECQSPLGALVNYTTTASAGCDAPVNIVCNPPSGSVFPIGTNTVTCAATDGYGRMDRCQFKIIVTNGPPTIFCPPEQTINVGPNCKAIMPLLPITVHERCTPTNQLFFSQNPPAGAVLSPGDHTVTITVSEGNHIQASCTTVVHVVDKTPPQIVCPSSIWKYCAPEGSTASYDASATDACGLPVLVTCEPPSGSFFPVGGTWVKCTATDAAGNSSDCKFMVNVTPASQFTSFVGGKKDNYAHPADAPTHSACLFNATPGLSLGSSFDVSFSGRWLGHSFQSLPDGIQWAKLRFKMKPMSNKASNDVIRIGIANCGAGGLASWQWSAPIASLPEAAGKWTVNADTIFTLDLSAMPAAPSALLPLLDIATSHRLDVLVGDDTIVDWVELNAGVCGISGAANGVPYVVKKGNAARKGDRGLRLFSDDERTLFDVDLNIGKADWIEFEVGEWPGNTNPPLPECTTTVGSYVGTEIEWKPGNEHLCTVKFALNPATPYVDVTLSQPTNIFGGRAIEIWRDGQMISRYFVEDGSQPGGVTLYNKGCVTSMGFGPGDFVLSLSEMGAVDIVNAKHVSGETEPMMGDFIRLVFNIPYTVPGNDPVRFDPDIVLNVKGRELDIRQVDIGKFGGLFETRGEGVMSVGDDVVVVPGPSVEGEEWTVSTCISPGTMPGDENNSQYTVLPLSDFFVGKEIKPGAAFNLIASAEYGTTPPIQGVIGRLHCEIASVSPMRVRFRGDYNELNVKPLVGVWPWQGNGFLGAEEVEFEGAPMSIGFSVVDNHVVFIVYSQLGGQNVEIDGQPVGSVTSVSWVAFDPPPGLHRAPYRFCFTPYQAWEPKPIVFQSPLPTPPPPAPHTPCVTMDCPTNVIAWSRKGEAVKVDFTVEARTACGTNLTLVCVPPSGSEFPVGITWVQCFAKDELGYQARCRFPVVVLDGEPKLSVRRLGDNKLRLWMPAEFHDWSIEGTRELMARRWLDVGRALESDGEGFFRDVTVGDPSVGDPTVGDPSVGDPFQFFRLRAP